MKVDPSFQSHVERNRAESQEIKWQYESIDRLLKQPLMNLARTSMSKKFLAGHNGVPPTLPPPKADFPKAQMKELPIKPKPRKRRLSYCQNPPTATALKKRGLLEC
jgi:hypothetical protein